MDSGAILDSLYVDGNVDKQKMTTESKEHRSYVGPPEVWDVMAGHVFSLMFARGLRGHHKVLDIGCGSLRIGRMLIIYLEPYGYFGIEPNGDVLKQGILQEVSPELIRLKEVSLIEGYGKDILRFKKKFNFVLAHSIFTHAGPTIIKEYLRLVAQVLAPGGEFLASFGSARWDKFQDNTEEGWFYPRCVRYKPRTLKLWAKKAGLGIVKVHAQYSSEINQSKRQTFMVLKKLGEFK